MVEVLCEGWLLWIEGMGYDLFCGVWLDIFDVFE